MVMFGSPLACACLRCFQTQPTRCHPPASSWVVLRETVLVHKKIERSQTAEKPKNKYRRNTKKYLLNNWIPGVVAQAEKAQVQVIQSLTLKE
jgi:hypothetical protein